MRLAERENQTSTEISFFIGRLEPPFVPLLAMGCVGTGSASGESDISVKVRGMQEARE